MGEIAGLERCYLKLTPGPLATLRVVFTIERSGGSADVMLGMCWDVLLALNSSIHGLGSVPRKLDTEGRHR